MATEEYRIFRSLVISLVLATDMANHASMIERMSTYFFFKEASSSNTAIDPKPLLQTVLHAADISNAAKPWPVYIRSAENVMEEFFIQGDLERIHCDDNKPTFDRETTNIAQLQIGFISHIVYPTVGRTHR
jgi:3'5'-cyclic nucleotide phosphodiesterase